MSQSQVRIRLAQDAAMRQLDALLDEDEAAGRYSLDGARLAQIGVLMGELTAERALRRLVAQGRLLRPSAHVAHWVIVPARHQGSALLPPELWMEGYFAGTLRINYYLGLLSAASLFGITETAPRLAHLAVERSRAPLTLGLFECRFHGQPSVASAPIQWHATAYGRVRVSTPEMTALDLAKRQARRISGRDLRPVIASLLDRSTESGLHRALTAAQNLDAAERLAEIAGEVAAQTQAGIAAWCEQFRNSANCANRAARPRRP